MPAQETVDQAFYIMLLYFLETIVNSKGSRTYKYMAHQSELYVNCVVTARGKIQLSNSDSKFHGTLLCTIPSSVSPPQLCPSSNDGAFSLMALYS